MAAVRNATPLIALDAVVIDTETTGLDPRKARVVEIAGVRLVAGRLARSAPFWRRVHPGEPIPAAAIRIHGIDDAAVADASRFVAVWPEFLAHIGDAVLVGHTLGFDLAVLKRECERIGASWVQPTVLDTRLLAAVAEPDLADYTLESLAAWLGIEITGRHSALGDATTTAQIFCALVPKLRQSGIRTLAEAARACLALTNALDQQHRAGWRDVSATWSESADERLPARVDSYPYRHRVGTLMTTPPKFVGDGTAIGVAAERMSREHISSLFVSRDGRVDISQPQDIGIVTERDVLRALADHGADALALPVTRAMSKPLITVPADAFAYLAIGRMNRLKIRHLGVTDKSGKVIGALSARDLLRLRAESAVLLEDEIDQAEDARDLARVWAKLWLVAASLVHEGLSGRDIAAVISHRLGAVTRRAAVLAEQRMLDAGQGDPPRPYAFLVVGSAGRGESLLAADQDNALIFADGSSGGADDRWFEALAVHVAEILHDVGIPYCQGGVMAKNPQWRGDVATWRQRVGEWIGRSNPQDLLSVDIFFDLRSVHGDNDLANALWQEAFDMAKGQAGFAKLLIDAAGSVAPGRNWFGGINTDKGRIDLKKTGLFGIVGTARALAICHNVTEHSTPARLDGIKKLGLGLEQDLDALAEAQGTFLDLVLKQQLIDLESGVPPSNRVDIRRLSRRERERLGAALKAVEHLQDIAQDLLFKS